MSTSTKTVGLIGASGSLGTALLKPLAKRHASGQLKLIILHRPTSDTSKFPEGIERRVLDADNASADEISKAIEGVNILISATKQTPQGGEQFVQRLAKVSSSLTVYVPSYFTANWTKEEGSNSENKYLNDKYTLRDTAVTLGLPITTIQCGLFEWAFLSPGFFGLDVKANEMKVWNKALESKFSFTSLAYLGETVAQIILDPKFGPGQEWTVVEDEFTGTEIVSALEKANGAPPKVTQMTDADIAEMRKAGPAVGLGASWRMHWGDGNWNAPNKYEPKGIASKRTLQNAVDDAKKA